MNFSGSHQRLTAWRQGLKGEATLSIVIRSRPVFVSAAQAKRMAPRRAQHEETLARGGSVWDEVRETATGALLRQIKIFITDGPQLVPDGPTRSRLDA